MIFDPPNLAKSPLRSDSIKILTKGLLNYSRRGVRMPKFRNFYRTSPEISTLFSLFSYSVSWQGRRGPFPWLEDCECKRARPPRGQAWPKAGVGPESGAFSSVWLVIWVFSFTEYIWSLSGSALRALNLVITMYHSIFFQFIRFSRGLQDWGQRSISNFSSSVWAFCGDEPHKICSQIFFNFWKKF